MNSGRDRSSGWQHAKLSGHENESDVENLFSDSNFRNEFSKRLGIGRIKSASVGGLCETDVPSVFGDKTKSKTDLQLLLEDGNTINISIKKSWGGQVYLIGVDRFIAGFEAQYKKNIPGEVKEALYLFFYGHSEIDSILKDPAIVGDLNAKDLHYVTKRRRLTKDLLEKYDSSKVYALLNWFKENIGLLADFCFSRGLAKNSSDWADYVWYINLLGEDDFNEIYSISDIKAAAEDSKDLVFYGDRGGGTTIQLPFGFVQWHLCQIQFHHGLGKLYEIIPESK